MSEQRKVFKSEGVFDDGTAPLPASEDMKSRAAELADEKGGISSEKSTVLLQEWATLLTI